MTKEFQLDTIHLMVISVINKCVVLRASELFFMTHWKKKLRNYQKYNFSWFVSDDIYWRHHNIGMSLSPSGVFRCIFVFRCLKTIGLNFFYRRQTILKQHFLSFFLATFTASLNSWLIVCVIFIQVQKSYN